MDARRSRNDPAQRVAEFRWWGCVLLAMFALVQTARGTAGLTAPPEAVRSDHPQSTPVRAVGTPSGHTVTLTATLAHAAWDAAEVRFASQPLQGPLHLFGSASPVGARSAAAAALSGDAGALQIQTP
jgi:hypothetical protein